MTKTPESAASQMNRLGHAIQAKVAKIDSDCLEAIVASETRQAQKPSQS